MRTTAKGHRVPDSALLTYEQYQEARKPLVDAVEAAGARLATYPKGAMGLTLDEAKDAAWYEDMRKVHRALGLLQRLALDNRAATRYKKEARAASQARRAKWGQT